MLFVQRNLVCFSCLLLSSSGAWQSLSPHSGHGANQLPQAWGRRHIALGTSAPAWLSGSAPRYPIAIASVLFFQTRKGSPFLPGWRGL